MPAANSTGGSIRKPHALCLRAPWKKVTITPIDISVKTRFTAEMKAVISRANTPVTQYLDKYSLPGYMWDEIAGAALIDPSIITGQKQLYMDIDLDHGASYGKTIFWDSKAQVPPYLRLGQCPIRYRRGKVLQTLHRPDDSASTRRSTECAAVNGSVRTLMRTLAVALTLSTRTGATATCKPSCSRLVTAG